MLLNNENVDYLLEWPAHYYEIEDINERERILQLAIEQKLDPALDEKRLLILRKRFGDHPAEKRADHFLRAWMMIQAASAGGVSFFQKKRQIFGLFLLQQQFSCLTLLLFQIGSILFFCLRGQLHGIPKPIKSKPNDGLWVFPGFG